jgi:deaminated glutathione amidase
MRIALLQMTSGIDPAANALAIEGAIAQAAEDGAAMLFTPEMSGLLDRDRKRASAQIQSEDSDVVLARTCEAASHFNIWANLGSLAIAEANGKWVNRSFVIDGSGTVRARYDKMHLFDVDLPSGESWRESSAYAAGSEPALVETIAGPLGLSICYDIRFPALYQALSAAGATLLSIPAAFTVPTGKAHWELLLRARAVENACFVIAAAQSGQHADGRQTYGHSMVVDPWGRVLLDMGEGAALAFVDIDLGLVDEARGRVPVISHRRDIGLVRKFE